MTEESIVIIKQSDLKVLDTVNRSLSVTLTRLATLDIEGIEDIFYALKPIQEEVHSIWKTVLLDTRKGR
jgi:hypothetical protein